MLIVRAIVDSNITQQMTAHRAEPELRLDLQKTLAGLRTYVFELKNSVLPSQRVCLSTYRP